MNLRKLPLVQLLLVVLAAACPAVLVAQPVINATAGKVGVPYSYKVNSSASGTVPPPRICSVPSRKVQCGCLR